MSTRFVPPSRVAAALIAMVSLGAESQAQFFAPEEFLPAHRDFVDASKRFTPDIELSGLFMPDAEVKHEKGDFDLWQWNVDGAVPIPVNRDQFATVGAFTGARYYDFDDAAAANERLFKFGLKLGGGMFINDDLMTGGYWQPSLFSDLDGTLTSKDWKLHYGNSLTVYRMNPELFIKGGFVVTDGFKFGVVPVGGVSWLFAPDWRLDVLLPAYAEVSHRPVETVDLQFGYELESDAYGVRETVAQGKRDKTVRVQEARLYVGGTYHFAERFSSFVKLGTTMFGNYDFGERYDGTLGANFFITWGLGYDFGS